MLHTTIIQPRFSETDKLGHISNTVLPVWMAESRSAFCRGALGITQPWVVANISIDFVKEIFHGDNVVITTSVYRIGSKSISFYQEIFQNNFLCAIGKTTAVCVDSNNKSCFVPSDSKEKLSEYLKYQNESVVNQ